MATYYPLYAYGDIFNVRPVRSFYTDNNTLAIILLENTGAEFAVITVNLEDSDFMTDKTCAFIDTNNCPWAEKFLQDTKLGSPKNVWASSGYCTYPLYTFDIAQIPEI